MFSKFFIERPVFASVISIVIFLAGLIAMFQLPVTQYPNIIPPDVTVTAIYPGASAEVIANSVASPLEQQVNGAPGMLYMRSTSSNSGQMTLTATFEIGTDADQAAIEVSNRVQTAISKLPATVRNLGVNVTKKSSSILEIVTMFSPDGTYDQLYVSNYALLYVLDELKRTYGVGDATLFGSMNYSMRIWLQPDKMAIYGLTSDDISNSIMEQNTQYAAGYLGQDPMKNDQAFTYTITTESQLAKVEDFENIVIRTDFQGADLLLKDVARIELGSQSYSVANAYNGKPGVVIAIYLQPGANAIATSKAVAEKMQQLAKRFPDGVAYDVPFNTTKFVQVSIEEVIKTFFEAIALVSIVVFVFLQNVRATLIPLIAVPVSLVGTFFGMYIFGFSINLLTLFGMVLAIGIVVDDAIVVLENIERIMSTEKLSPKDAAIKAMTEVTGPIIAIVFVLCAVFVPVGFMGGLTGEMYQQFAITIAVSVVISGIVALTLTPALCAVIIKESHEKPHHLLQKFNVLFEYITSLYIKGVTYIINHSKRGLQIFAVMVLLTVFLLNKIPTSLVPEEDQGYILTVPILLPGASLSRTIDVMDTMLARAATQPEVKDIVSIRGFDLLSGAQRTNSGAAFLSLQDWSKRKDPASSSQALTYRLMGMNADLKDAVVIAFNPPPITGISLTGGFDCYLQSLGGASIQTLTIEANKLVDAANKRPELAGVKTTISTNVPQYKLNLDTTKARALGVSLSTIYDTMQSTFGSLYVNDFTIFGRTFQVNMQSDAEFRETPENLKHVFVRSAAGNMIPLDSLITLERIIGPDLVDRFNIFPAAKIMGGPAPGYSSGQAIAAMDELSKTVLSNDYTLNWSGAAYQEKLVGKTGIIIFALGILMVILILAAQYESWTLPFAVIMTVPFAVFGASIAVWVRGLNNDVYFQVGILTLIGLSAKNAILIIEFAVIQYKNGMPIVEAAIEGAQLRFRPIVMTSIAFILGCIPLAISTGAGAASRHSIGTGVIGGMLAATCVATFFIPMFFKIIYKAKKIKKKISK